MRAPFGAGVATAMTGLRPVVKMYRWKAVLGKPFSIGSTAPLAKQIG